MLVVDGFGVSTSGDYRNYFEENGQRYSHTFDARLGRPVKHDLAAVTVFDRSTLMADGYSTLLLVLGPQQGWDFALKHQIAAVFVTRVADGFVSRSTPAFEQVTAKD
ncbi:Thiamine biosynthesis lipoprotein ApbE precursor [compost metagenome]